MAPKRGGASNAQLLARVAALQLQNKMLKKKCAAQAKCFRDIRRVHKTFRSKVVKGWGWLLFVRQFPVASVRDGGMQLLLEDLG